MSGFGARRPGLPLLLAVSSLGAILAPLNSTMMAVGLPEIRREFALSHATAGWLISGYLIAMAVAQPLGGRLGDQVGRVRVFRGGLLAFLVLSIGAMLAPTFPVLVAFRMAQAVAGAVLIPNGMAMLRMAAPPERLGRLNGINGSILSAAAASGPLLGAAALALGSWRLVFLLSMPFPIAALVLLPRLHLQEERTTARAPIDWLGTALFVGLLGGVTLQLSALRDGEDTVTSVVRWLAVVAVGGGFIWRQWVTPAPAAEWRLFRVRSFSAATAGVLLTNLTMYTTLLMIPFFVRDAQGKSTQLSGLLLGAMSVCVAITSPFGGRLSDAFGRRPLAMAGSVLALIGSVALLSILRTGASAVSLAVCLGLLGIGLGLGTGASMTAAIESAPVEQSGTASGTSSMMRYVGSILGAGLLAGVLSEGSAGQADVATFRLLGLVVVATAAMACVAATFIHTFPHRSITPVSGNEFEPDTPGGMRMRANDVR